MGAVANDLEGEQIPLVDRPEVDGSALRVVGPFEVMTLGRYSIESWRGGLSGAGGGAISENYVSAMCRLYRSDADLLESGGLIHAVIEDGGKTVAVSIGPLTGRVSASQLEEVARDAASAGMDAVHILGWAFEANVGEVMDRLVASQGVGIELIMIRPDALAEGLKVTQPSMLFSPLALPEVDVESLGSGKEGQWVANLRGVTVFDRETRKSAYHLAESSYVVAWYLDEDYDGDCFVDCQMFFNFKKAPNLRTAAAAEVDADEFEIRFRSDPFSPGKYNRIAVKVVDVYGNESTVIKELKP